MDSKNTVNLDRLGAIIGNDHAVALERAGVTVRFPSDKPIRNQQIRDEYHKSYITQEELAVKYGLSKRHIGRIVSSGAHRKPAEQR